MASRGGGPKGWLTKVSIAAVLIAAPEGLLAQDAGTQSTEISARLDAMQRQIDAKNSELQALRDELATLRAKVMPEPPERYTTKQWSICRMESPAQFDLAYSERVDVVECLDDSKAQASSREIQRVEAARALANSIAQALPERPNQSIGLAGSLSLSDSSRAALTYTHPFLFGTMRTDEDGFRSEVPQVGTLSISGSVPIEEGKAKIASYGDELTAASGIGFKAAYDFTSFRRANRTLTHRRTADFLYKAMKECADSRGRGKIQEELFYDHYGFTRDPNDAADYVPRSVGPRSAAPLGGPCTGDQLIAWVLESERDAARSEGYKMKREKLAAEYWSLYWSDPDIVVPDYGWGVSLERTWTNFTYRQATFAGAAEGDPFNLSVPLAAERSQIEDGLTLQGYVSGYWWWRDGRISTQRTVSPYTDGLMGILLAGYKVEHEQRDKTDEVSVCEAPNPGQVYGDCFKVDIDRPYERDGLFFGSEVRFQFNNVPVFKVLGIAPKYLYRPEDGRHSLDVPLYFVADEKGRAAAGVRFLHAEGGEDPLGEALESKSEVSLFFKTPLSFGGM